jgi:outer membrane protein assembly complex protein YaeT
MERSWKVLCLSALFLTVGVTFAAESVIGTEDVIDRVETTGNVTISSNSILSRIRSRAGEVFDEATAAEDAERIAELEGVEYSYYSTSLVEGEFVLTFVVVERPLVRRLEFNGNKKIKYKTLIKESGLKLGEYLDVSAVANASDKINAYYKKKGFAFASVKLDNELLPSGHAVFEIEENSRVKIASVKFVGNRSIGKRTLARAIQTEAKWFYVVTQYLNEEKVQEDLVGLLEIYQDKGHLDAKVYLKREYNEVKDRVKLTFEISEGAVYTIKEMTFAGNSHFDEGKLRSELKLSSGDPYSDNRVSSDRKRLVKMHRETGFINAQVDWSREFVADREVKVNYQIAEGGRFRIGQINITGNQRTQDRVARRVLDEYDFQPGKWYNADIARGDGEGYLEKLVRRQMLAESTTITPLGTSEGSRDAHVSIKEGQTGSVMLGAGVASDSGVIGQLVYEQRNFDIADRPESIKEFLTGQAFKGAGQHFRISLQPGTEVSEYSVSFSDPYFRDKPINMDVVASSYERERESYDEGRTKGYVGFERRFKTGWRRSVGFRVENVDISDLDSDAPKEVREDKGNNLLVGFKLGFGRDETDDNLNPSTGRNYRVSYEQVGGNHTFGILNATYKRYRTLFEDVAERKTVLATQVRGGAIVGNAPVFEKFYGGGQGSIRGFDYRGVSKRAPNDDPIGSDWILLANAEIIKPLATDNLAMLFFVDTGTIDTGGVRAAIGTGLQITMPQWFGPVPMRFEFAVPMVKKDEDDTEVFSFSIGRLF